MLPECVLLPDFDMIEFITAGLSLSIVISVWTPPDSVNLRIHISNPVSQSREGWVSVFALCCWADRTDPEETQRKAFYQQSWDEREPGQEIVILDGTVTNKNSSRTGLLLSL